MKIIVITPPYAMNNEAELILAALSAGAYRVHIRKPDWSREKTAELIESIPPFLRDRITIHDHFDLYEELGVGGLHVNGRNPATPAYFDDTTSRSCHSIEELRANQHLDYTTISPIYDSLSKRGYFSNFSHEELLRAKEDGYIGDSTIALGGITPERIPGLSYLGFGGAALMGYVWAEESVEEVRDRVKAAVKVARLCSNFSLQYITHANETKSTLDGAEAALRGGARWVQLRQKGASDEEFIRNAERIRVECDKVGATFIINDRVDLVQQTEADGVHLGKEDMSPAQARAILGKDAIIGGTANTCEDIDRLVSQGVDYIGLGPFRFTSTKERLSPTLGLEGYRQAVKHCVDKQYTTPIVAIGGITTEDVQPLFKCLIMGVAVSGEILSAEDSEAKTWEFIEKIENVK